MSGQSVGNTVCSGIEEVITGLTRNQFVSNHTWVRIPPAAPFGGYGVYSPQPFSLLICWGFPALEHPAHSRRRLLLGGEVQVGIDVGGGGEGAVAQPDLYLFHRDAVTQQKAGTSVPLWHNKDKSENPCVATGWLVCPYSFSTKKGP